MGELRIIGGIILRAEFMEDYEKLFRRVGGKECGNCGSKSNLHLHHIVPIGKGGTNRIGNLVVICKECHVMVHGDIPFVKGIKTTSEQLTYVNLRKWRLIEKLTYEEISDITGAHFSTVAKASRKFGITGVTNKDRRKKTAIDDIIDYFASMESGERVKQSTIYKELDISRNTFGRQVDTPKFNAAMEKYGITKEKTFYSRA